MPANWHGGQSTRRHVITDADIVTTPHSSCPRIISHFRRFLENGDLHRYAAAVDRAYSTSTLLAILDRGDAELRRAAVTALRSLGGHSAVEPLGRALADPDRSVRQAADVAFRQLVVRDAAPTHQRRLLQVIHLNEGGEHAAALPPTLILADQAPDYAEVHHQLAVCWQGLDDLDAAEAAYCSGLWHCRFHYPAWLGLANCRIAAGDVNEAIEALRQALSICPDLEMAKTKIEALRQRSRQDSRE